MSAINYKELYGVPSYNEFYDSYLYDKYLKSNFKINGERGSFDQYKEHFDIFNQMAPGKFEQEVLEAYNNQFGYLNEKIADNILADLKTESARNYEQLYDEQRYPRLMAGLESAGINPLYAVNGATAGGGSGVATSQTNMASTSTARDEMRVRNAISNSQIELNKMQGIASLVGALGTFVGALGGASHNFGFTTSKTASNVVGNYKSNTSTLFKDVSEYLSEVLYSDGEVYKTTYKGTSAMNEYWSKKGKR